MKVLQINSRFIIFKLTLFALVPILIWWFIVFPGYFSPDSGGIVTQVRTGKWDNWHTTLYVAFVAVTSAFGKIPALSIFMQALLFSIALAKLFFVLQPNATWSTKDYLTISGFAIMPQVAGFVLTLWKDPVYASFALLITSSLIEQGRNSRLDSKVIKPAWLISLFGLSAFRWNGFITAGSTLLTGLITRRLPRKFNFLALSSLAITISVASLILTPKLLPVAGVDWLFFNSPKLHDISVLISKDQLRADYAQKNLIERIMPISEWREAGENCRSHDTLIFTKFPANKETAYSTIYSNTKALDELWLENIISQPQNVLPIRLCRAESSLSPIPSSNNLPPGLWFQDNLETVGLKQSRFIPLATDFANYTLAYISTNWILQWLLLHAPIWVFIYVISTRGSRLRQGSAPGIYTVEVLTVSLAIIFSSAASAVAQDLRYTIAATIILQLATLVQLRKIKK